MPKEKLNESVEQTCLFRWADFAVGQHPELALLHHIPNGGHRSQSTAKRLKGEGVKAGVPDVCLPVARGNYHGLYIEMKVNGNKPSEIQNFWLCALKNQGYGVCVCNSWEHAKETIERYLSIK